MGKTDHHLCMKNHFLKFVWGGSSGYIWWVGEGTSGGIGLVRVRVRVRVCVRGALDPSWSTPISTLADGDADVNAIANADGANVLYASATS